MKLVTVAAFSQPPEAHIARIRLEAEGIPAVLENENVVGWSPFYSLAVGGVKLKVREEDAARAREVLAGRPGDPTSVSEETEGEKNERCPFCHSTNTLYERYSFLMSLLGLLCFMLPMPIPKRKWVCRDCGRRWKEKD